jgi:hypothetical protein
MNKNKNALPATSGFTQASRLKFEKKNNHKINPQ